MPVVSYHALELLLIAHQARNRAIEDAKRPNALTTDSVVAIVMAAAASEAFVNEFAEYIIISREAASESLRNTVTPAMSACADAIEELEDSKAPVTGKYLIASLVLCGASFPKDRAPFQDFAELIRLRNSIMHIKPATGDDANHQGTRITDSLAQRGIATRKEPDVGYPWLNRLEVSAVASWACGAARDIIVAIIDMLPTPNEAYDPFEILRKSYRAHPGFA
jgi:hypothetical protein